jgi:Na+-driven multidrug efflux pump
MDMQAYEAKRQKNLRLYEIVPWVITVVTAVVIVYTVVLYVAGNTQWAIVLSLLGSGGVMLLIAIFMRHGDKSLKCYVIAILLVVASIACAIAVLIRSFFQL